MNESRKTSQCERCGAPIEDKPDYPTVCDDCYAIYGSCCNDWESSEEDDC